MPHRLLDADGVAVDRRDAVSAAVWQAEDDRATFPDGVRAAVFDVVGTLVGPSPSVVAAYAAVATRHGVAAEIDELETLFAAAWKHQEGIDSQAVPAYETSRQRERQRWQQIVRDVFADRCDCVTAERIFDDLWEHFGLPAAWTPTRRGPLMVQAALDAGLEVVLASNFDERLYDVAAVVEPLSLATRVFPSSELGWRKPAVEFYRAVEMRLGLEPAELVMFGDNPALDVAAARAAGWHAVLLADAAG